MLLYPENVFFFLIIGKGLETNHYLTRLPYTASPDTKKQLDWCILPQSAVIEKQALNKEGKILEKKEKKKRSYNQNQRAGATIAHNTKGTATVQVNGPPASLALFDCWVFISALCGGSTSGPQRWRADQVGRWKIKELYAVDKWWLRTEVKRDSQVWRIRLLRPRWRADWQREQAEFGRNTRRPSGGRFRWRPGSWWALRSSPEISSDGQRSENTGFWQRWRLADDTQVWREAQLQALRRPQPLPQKHSEKIK